MNVSKVILLMMKSKSNQDLKIGVSKLKKQQQKTKQKKKTVAEFQFLYITLKMKMDYFCFLRSIRSTNPSLHVYLLDKLLQWMFGFDLCNYPRWMSVHQFDMEMLEETNPKLILNKKQC